MKRNVPRKPHSPQTEKRIAYALLVLAMVLWGLSFVVTKVVLNEGIPPLTFNAIRFMISAVLIAPVFKFVGPKNRLKREHVGVMMLAGLFGVALYFILETIGMQYTSASNASLIVASIPIFTLLAEVAFFKKKVILVQVAGILLSLAGVYLLIAQAGFSLGDGSLLGSLMVLGACLSWVVYVIVTRNVVEQYSGIAFTAYQIILGSLLLCPFALLERESWRPISALGWGCIVFLALTCSIAAYAAYNYALKRLGSVVVSTFLNLIPVVSVAAGMFFLQERITLLQGIGGVVVIGSILLITLYDKPVKTVAPTSEEEQITITD